MDNNAFQFAQRTHLKTIQYAFRLAQVFYLRYLVELADALAPAQLFGLVQLMAV